MACQSQPVGVLPRLRPADYDAADFACGARRRLERVKGIEPSSQAWEAHILPLNHTRTGSGLICKGSAREMQVRKERTNIVFTREEFRWSNGVYKPYEIIIGEFNVAAGLSENVGVGGRGACGARYPAGEPIREDQFGHFESGAGRVRWARDGRSQPGFNCRQ